MRERAVAPPPLRPSLLSGRDSPPHTARLAAPGRLAAGRRPLIPALGGCRTEVGVTGDEPGLLGGQEGGLPPLTEDRLPAEDQAALCKGQGD